ncbi:hypothetical protein [Streptomyces sp. NPDC058773]|uniref:hypothetical protein n=1 Tax=Streptomyces sp. NPDC058773 TaxID=3346632 RepID=UPI00369F043E
MSTAKIGVALVGGYLLGRTKKAKMAIGLGMFLAGRKLKPDSRQLRTLVANSPVLGPLNDQVRKELVDATKAAAGTALTQRMNGLAGSLRERTAALAEGQETADEAERTPGDEHPRPAAAEEEQRATDEKQQRAAPTEQGRERERQREKTSPGSAGRRTTARRAAGSASGARKKSAAAARTAADRGGRHG